jgi:hypothetical protein
VKFSRATSLVLAALLLTASGARAEGRRAQGTKQKPPKILKAPEPPREERFVPPPPDTTKEAPRDRGCALGDLCLGPLLSLGAVNALGVGLVARYGERLGLGIDYQTTPTIGGATRVGLTSFTGSARLYLTENLFVFGGVARQSATITTTESNVSATSSTVLFGPVFGAGWMSRGGLVLGFDLGIMVPLHRDTQTSFDASRLPAGVPYETARQIAESRVGSLASDIPVVPQLNLLRVGYVF